jgi:hypothetical protein
MSEEVPQLGKMEPKRLVLSTGGGKLRTSRAAIVLGLILLELSFASCFTVGSPVLRSVPTKTGAMSLRCRQPILGNLNCAIVENAAEGYLPVSP